MKYEYVIYAGEGTLIEHGVREKWEWDVNPHQTLVNDMAEMAFNAGYSIQAEPCADDCATGE